MKLRYKNPKENNSNLLIKEVNNRVLKLKDTSEYFNFTAAIAAWGMKLKNSEYAANISYKSIIKWAKSSKSEDKLGNKAEMVRLLRTVNLLSQNN